MLITVLALGILGMLGPGWLNGIRDMLVTMLANDMRGTFVGTDTGLPVDMATDLGTGSVGRETEMVVLGIPPT